jgi:hypothetical protein
MIPENRAVLTLGLPRDGRHQIKVNLALDYDRHVQDRRRLGEIKGEIKDLENSQKKLEAEDEANLASLKVERDHLQEYARRFDHIYGSQETTLSITIGLKISESDLDVARFGSIPDPPR